MSLIVLYFLHSTSGSLRSSLDTFYFMTEKYIHSQHLRKKWNLRSSSDRWRCMCFHRFVWGIFPLIYPFVDNLKHPRLCVVRELFGDCMGLFWLQNIPDWFTKGDVTNMEYIVSRHYSVQRVYHRLFIFMEAMDISFFLKYKRHFARLLSMEYGKQANNIRFWSCTRLPVQCRVVGVVLVSLWHNIIFVNDLAFPNCWHIIRIRQYT